MAIRWSAVAVSEAMDKVEKELEPIYEHLWRAHNTARDALRIPNLPQYMEQSIKGVTWEIQRIAGDEGGKLFSGNLADVVTRVRKDIPEGSVEQEKAGTRHGKTGDLFAA